MLGSFWLCFTALCVECFVKMYLNIYFEKAHITVNISSSSYRYVYICLTGSYFSILSSHFHNNLQSKSCTLLIIFHSLNTSFQNTLLYQSQPPAKLCLEHQQNFVIFIQTIQPIGINWGFLCELVMFPMLSPFSYGCSVKKTCILGNVNTPGYSR